MESRKRQPTLKKHAVEEAKAYCDATTLHGFAYLPPSNSFGKLIWALALITAYILAFIIVSNMIMDWESNPVVTVIDSTTQPIQGVQVGYNLQSKS